MRYILAIIAMPLLIAASYPVPPKAERGRNGADCRASEPGPAVRVDVQGLKDRKGKLVLELYPENDKDFLQSDKVLIAAGKPFRRVPVTTPGSGPISLCIRAPGPGRYAIALLHDRDGNGKFGLSSDGVGFANNPKLGLGKPKAKVAAVALNSGTRNISITLNYRKGIGVGPLSKADAVGTRSGGAP
jgi:uncharacterized protein (DUF2141 family)